MRTLKRELLSNTNAMRKVKALARYMHRKLHYTGWTQGDEILGQNLHRELCYEPDSQGHN